MLKSKRLAFAAPVEAGRFYLPERRGSLKHQETRRCRKFVEALFAAGHIRNKASALAQLEYHFRNSYVFRAGSTKEVAQFAEHLRLDITETECVAMLNHTAQKAMVGITINNVEAAFYKLLGNRFIEPE